ncbi:MAG TPA: hypothetical protein VML54_17520 [Candidatus Limnocylindrales bacterium]|nr:hypothetical protein [Candidatus Limnocylindrales bacterium]
MTLAKMALLFALYVSLDLSNPMMPGALTFGVEESVDMRQSDRVRGGDDAALTPLRGPERFAPPERSVTPLRAPAPVTAGSRRAHVTRSHPSLPTAPSSSEDH